MSPFNLINRRLGVNQTVEVHVSSLADLVGIQRGAQLYPRFRRVCKLKTSICRSVPVVNNRN